MSNGPRTSVWTVIHDLHSGREPLFLLGRRSSAVNNSKSWNFFGGRCEKHECPQVAAKRELLEEACIRAETLRLVLTIDIERCHFMFYSLPYYSNLSPTLGTEHDDYGWFTIGQINSILLHNPTKEFFKDTDLQSLTRMLQG